MLKYLQEKLGMPVSLALWEAADHFALYLTHRARALAVRSQASGR